MTRVAPALLAESVNYREVVELRPCDAVPSLVEFRITSQYMDAKHPEALQVRFQAMVDRAGLEALKIAIDETLANFPRPDPKGKS